jgi:hypothetical protein
MQFLKLDTVVRATPLVLWPCPAPGNAGDTFANLPRRNGRNYSDSNGDEILQCLDPIITGTGEISVMLSI